MYASRLERTSNNTARHAPVPLGQGRVMDVPAARVNVTAEAVGFTHGESLRAKLDRHGNLPPIAAVQLLLPVVEQLRDGQEQGFPRAAIDPDAIRVMPCGANHIRAVLTAATGDAQDVPGVRWGRGAHVELPHYLPPECIKGSGVGDARSHVWSLCVVLYELLAGNLPFEAYTRDGLLFAIAERPPARPPRDVADARLWRVVFKGLCKEPSRRFQTVAQLGYALAAWLDERDVKVDCTGKCVRAAWLNDTPPRDSVGPNSRALCLTKPNTSAGHSRMPSAQGNTLRGAGLVIAIAASVFFLFELTFANSTPAKAPSLLLAE